MNDDEEMLVYYILKIRQYYVFVETRGNNVL